MNSNETSGDRPGESVPAADADHVWFHDRIEAYLAGGLVGGERARFEGHAGGCAACAAVLSGARSADAAVRALLAPLRPAGGFEDRAVRRLRDAQDGRAGKAVESSPASPRLPGRRWVHPMVRRAGLGAAASLVLGCLGYVGNEMIRSGSLPEPGTFFAQGPTYKAEGRIDDGYTLQNARNAEINLPADAKPGIDLAGGTAPGYYGFPTFQDRASAETQGNLLQGRWFGRVGRVNDAESQKWRESSEQELRAVQTTAEAQTHAELARAKAQTLKLNLNGGNLTKTGGGALGTVSVPDGGTLLLGGQVVRGETESRSAFTAGPAAGVPGSIGSVESLDATNGVAVSYDGPRHGVALERSLDESERNGRLSERNDSAEERAKDAKPLAKAKEERAGPRGTEHFFSTQLGSASNQAEGRKERYEDVLRSPQNWSAQNGRLGDEKKSPGGDRPGGTTPGVATLVDGDPSDYFGEAPGKPADRKGERVVVISDGNAAVASAPGAATALPADKDARQPQAKPAAPVTPPPAAQVQPAPPPATQAAGGGGARSLTPTDAVQRKIIRNGEMEFEVDRFDGAAAQVNKILDEEGGYVASTDSQKLPNGKVRGMIVLRVPPERLDTLALKLRGIGDLKTQRIAAQDVTKQYTDTESELRAARTMEERLLELLKNAKGQVKDLLATEQALSVERSRIERLEGEIRFFNSLISLSTLNVTLYEKDIRTPTAAYETETVNAGIETEEVEKARAEATRAIEEAKGHVVESQLQKHEADQFTATIVAEVPPDASGPLIDRLRQLGRMNRLDVDRRQTAQGGSGGTQTVLPAVKVERKETRLNLSIFNLTGQTPKETTNVTVACADVEAAYRTILGFVNADDAGNDAKPADGVNGINKENPGGNNPRPARKAARVVSSNLNSQRAEQTTGSINLEVRADRAAAVEGAVRDAGEVLKLSVSANADAQNVTRAKQGFVVTLVPLTAVPARESYALQVASRDVPGTYYKLLALVQGERSERNEPGPRPAPGGPIGRVVSSQLSEQDRQNVNGTLVFEIRRGTFGLLESAVAGQKGGEVLSRNVTRAADTANASDSKVRVEVKLIDAARLDARQTHALAVEAADVESAVKQARAAAEANGGYALDADAINGRAVLDVPLAGAPALLDQLKALGAVRQQRSSENMQAPAGALARARFDLTLTPAARIRADGGLATQFKRGMNTSLAGLLWTVQMIVIGLFLIVPWVLIVWFVVWVVRRLVRKNKGKTAAPLVTPTP